MYIHLLYFVGLQCVEDAKMNELYNVMMMIIPQRLKSQTFNLNSTFPNPNLNSTFLNPVDLKRLKLGLTIISNFRTNFHSQKRLELLDLKKRNQISNYNSKIPDNEIIKV